MTHAQEIQLQIREQESSNGELQDSHDEPNKATAKRRLTRGSAGWWMTVVVDMLMVLCGGTVGTLLGRLYYNSGGKSKWVATLTQSCGAPLLAIPLLLTPPPPPEEEEQERPPAAASKVAAVCVGLGVLLGFDNLMYAYALLYLPVSTFSLVAATQLAFNAVTSRLINAQRFTPLVANSVVVLTFAAALLGLDTSSPSSGSGGGDDAPRGKYALGFVLTLAAAATFALFLSLVEAAFERVIVARTTRWVLRVQMHTNLVATAVGAAGLFASGEWRTLPAEMAAFRDGRARYVLTLAGTAVCWQAAALGTVRLVAGVSSLFANVTGTVALPLVPVFAVVLFGDRMTGVKAVAMLMAVWGFLSYVYQHYLDGRRKGTTTTTQCCVCAARTAGETAC